jgi:hypothetical protein
MLQHSDNLCFVTLGTFDFDCLCRKQLDAATLFFEYSQGIDCPVMFIEAKMKMGACTAACTAYISYHLPFFDFLASFSTDAALVCIE